MNYVRNCEKFNSNNELDMIKFSFAKIHFRSTSVQKFVFFFFPKKKLTVTKKKRKEMRKRFVFNSVVTIISWFKLSTNSQKFNKHV